MKQTVTLRWRTLGFAVAIGLGFLLAITPDNFARGSSGEAPGAAMTAALPAAMPVEGFAVEPAALAAWLGNGTPLSLVDVRTRQEYDEYHLEGAVHVPATEVVAPGALDGLPGDPVIVIAQSDIAAGHFVAALRLAGRDAWALRGGLTGWRDEVLRPDAAPAIAPTAPPPPAPATPDQPRQKAKRGKGC